MPCILGYQLFHQGLFCNILYIHVNGRNHIGSVPGFYFIPVVDGHPYIAIQPLHEPYSFHAIQLIFIRSFNTYHVAVLIFCRITDKPGRKILMGSDPFVLLQENKAALVFSIPEDGKGF